MTTDYESPPHRSKKNTKRWCKGKVGTPHQPDAWAAKSGMNYWWEKKCMGCGKVLDWWIKWTGGDAPPADLAELMANADA